MTSPKLRPQALQKAAWQFWVIASLPPGHTVADLLDPGFWSTAADRLRVHDLVRVIAADGSLDVMVTVRSKTAASVAIELWPKLPADFGTDAVAGTAAHND